MSKNSLTALCFVFLYSVSSCLSANVEVLLAEPNWEFIIATQPLGQIEVQLQPNERSFAEQIQPLLESQNYTAVASAFDSRPIEEDSPALRQLRGQILLSLKRYNQAEVALQSAISVVPDLALSHRSLSMLYMLQKDYSRAREHLVRSIELGVADAQVYGQLAYVNVQTGYAASAVAGYQQAIFLDPSNGQWQQGLLYALIDSNALAQAQALVEQMLLEDSSRVDLWLLRSQIALQDNRPEMALSSLEVAISLGENSTENLVTTAQLHLQQGSSIRAVELLGNNLSRFHNGTQTQDSKDSIASFLETVDQATNWLIYQNDWLAASNMLKNLEDVSRSLPLRYQSKFDLYRAQINLNEGNKTQAKTWLNSSIEADPSNGEALMALAGYYREENELERALIQYVRAESLPMFQERALLGRAQLEIDRQSYAEALRLLRQVVNINPARDDVLKNIQSLENLVRNQA